MNVKPMRWLISLDYIHGRGPTARDFFILRGQVTQAVEASYFALSTSETGYAKVSNHRKNVDQALVARVVYLSIGP